jgi:hypothetical protein
MIKVVISPDSGCCVRRRRGEAGDLGARGSRQLHCRRAALLRLRCRYPRDTRGPCSAFYGRTTSAAKGAVRDVSQVERR